MPTLTLTVVRHPEYGCAETRHVQGTSLTVGRGAECDWALPDPLKMLSRRHFQLECVGGHWQVRDLSSNGTFVNSAADAIGRDTVRAAVDGDRLRLGDYEIEVRIQAEPTYARSPAPTPDLYFDPIGGASPRGFAAVRLPGLDDPLPGAAPQGHGPAIQSFGAMPDHGQASAEAFVMPASDRVAPPPAMPVKPIVPDDWYLQAGPAPAPAPWLPPPAPEPRAAPLAAPVPAPVDLAVDLSAPGPAPIAAGSSMASAVALMMSGADLQPDLHPRAAADPEATLRTAGALLRSSVAGVRALLIARGSVKREFRIEQTQLRVQENNPLKFAATDEQALTALLDPRGAGLSAMQKSIEDLTLHQLAVLAATQAAARAMLEQLSPAALEAEDKGGGLFGSAEKRLWEAYKRRHATMIDQFEDDFESAFGKSFALAYEQAVRDERA